MSEQTTNALITVAIPSITSIVLAIIARKDRAKTTGRQTGWNSSTVAIIALLGVALGGISLSLVAFDRPVPTEVKTIDLSGKLTPPQGGGSDIHFWLRTGSAQPAVVSIAHQGKEIKTVTCEPDDSRRGDLIVKLKFTEAITTMHDLGLKLTVFQPGMSELTFLRK
jgi:hypothetical protein